MSGETVIGEERVSATLRLRIGRRAIALHADRRPGVGGSLRLNFLDHVWRPAWQQCEREEGDRGRSHAAHDLLPAWQIKQRDEKKGIENAGNHEPGADG